MEYIRKKKQKNKKTKIYLQFNFEVCEIDEGSVKLMMPSDNIKIVKWMIRKVYRGENMHYLASQIS